MRDSERVLTTERTSWVDSCLPLPWRSVETSSNSDSTSTATKLLTADKRSCIACALATSSEAPEACPRNETKVVPLRSGPLVHGGGNGSLRSTTCGSRTVSLIRGWLRIVSRETPRSQATQE